jgi:hypothetical protein
LFDGLHGLAEEVHVKLLELGTGQSLGEVVTILERLDFDAGALLVGQSALGLFNLTLQLAHGTKVRGDIGTGLLLVLLDEVVDNTVVEVLTTKVSITSGSQYLEDTVINGKKGDIEGSTTEIIDNNLALAMLLVKTVGDGSGGGLVDDTEDSETGNRTGILGSLTLSVVEVGRDGNDGVGDLLTKVSLGGLLHLGENHGRDFLGGEITDVAVVLDLDRRFFVLLDDLERPMLDVTLDVGVIHLAANETLSVEDRVLGVGVECILCGITNAIRNVSNSRIYMYVIANTHRRSSSVKDTHEGVIRWPWSLAIISTCPPRWTPTQEYL